MAALFKIAFSLVFAVLPLGLLFAKGPPTHGSWWYPRVERWDYPFKLLLYAIVDANTPGQASARWFVRVIALMVLLGGLLVIWFAKE